MTQVKVSFKSDILKSGVLSIFRHMATLYCYLITIQSVVLICFDSLNIRQSSPITSNDHGHVSFQNTWVEEIQSYNVARLPRSLDIPEQRNPVHYDTPQTTPYDYAKVIPTEAYDNYI